MPAKCWVRTIELPALLLERSRKGLINIPQGNVALLRLGAKGVPDDKASMWALPTVPNRHSSASVEAPPASSSSLAETIEYSGGKIRVAEASGFWQCGTR